VTNVQFSTNVNHNYSPMGIRCTKFVDIKPKSLELFENL